MKGRGGKEGRREGVGRRGRREDRVYGDKSLQEVLYFGNGVWGRGEGNRSVKLSDLEMV